MIIFKFFKNTVLHKKLSYKHFTAIDYPNMSDKYWLREMTRVTLPLNFPFHPPQIKDKPLTCYSSHYHIPDPTTFPKRTPLYASVFSNKLGLAIFCTGHTVFFLQLFEGTRMSFYYLHLSKSYLHEDPSPKLSLK